MIAFLAGYVVPAGAGLAGDPGLKAPQRAVSSSCPRAPALALVAVWHRAAATRAGRHECARLSSSPNGADHLAKLTGEVPIGRLDSYTEWLSAGNTRS